MFPCPKLVYIWATHLVCAVVDAQISTFFVRQGSTMDRRILQHPNPNPFCHITNTGQPLCDDPNHHP